MNYGSLSIFSQIRVNHPYKIPILVEEISRKESLERLSCEHLKILIAGDFMPLKTCLVAPPLKVNLLVVLLSLGMYVIIGTCVTANQLTCRCMNMARINS